MFQLCGERDDVAFVDLCLGKPVHVREPAIEPDLVDSLRALRRLVNPPRIRESGRHGLFGEDVHAVAEGGEDGCTCRVLGVVMYTASAPLSSRAARSGRARVPASPASFCAACGTVSATPTSSTRGSPRRSNA